VYVAGGSGRGLAPARGRLNHLYVPAYIYIYIYIYMPFARRVKTYSPWNVGIMCAGFDITHGFCILHVTLIQSVGKLYNGLTTFYFAYGHMRHTPRCRGG
jgi:hypothetical protein